MRPPQKELSNPYLSSLCLELSMLLSSGITPYEAVLMLYEDEPDKEGQILIQSLLKFLENGAPLSESLRKSGHFPNYMANMTEAGEKTGHLTDTLNALSDYYNRMENLSTAVRSAILYPSVLLVMMCAVVLILIVQVLPVFNGVFGRIGAQMPPLSVWLMQFGQWLGGASSVIAVTMGALFVSMFAIRAIPQLRDSMSRTFINVLGERGIFGRISASRFMYVMALASASGIDYADAAELAALAGAGAAGVVKRYKQCADLLREGGTISDSMLSTGIISVQNARLLSVGARGGKTDAALTEIAMRLDRETQTELERLVGKIEPTLVIITSTIVGCILLSVMLPLMSIMTTIG